MLLLNHLVAVSSVTLLIHLHFNMLLLNRYESRDWYSYYQYLHFNMLLLNLELITQLKRALLHLHFNMLLLNPVAEDISNGDWPFTFQYASIKPQTGADQSERIR